MSRTRRVVLALAGVCTALAFLAWLARESAMAALVALEPVAMALASLALGLVLASGAWRRGDAQHPHVPTIAVVLAIVACGAFAAAAHAHFLTYRSWPAHFRNGEVVLAGTIYLPPSTGPHPGAVLVHGSGPETRRGYAVYGRYLARRGIAVIAYDKRGTGQSTGALYDADYADYASDALAALGALADVPDVDAERLGLVAFSEGEWIAPIAALATDRVAYIAVIGASGVSPAEQVDLEMAIRLRSSAFDDQAVRAARGLHARLLAYQRTGVGGADLDRALRTARGEPWFDAAEDFPETVYAPEAYAWWRGVMDVNPDSLWSRTRVPVLLLKGGRDDRSPADTMAIRIGAARAGGGSPPPEVRIYEDADHMLLEWPLGEGTPPPRWADDWLPGLASWIHTITR